MTEFILLALLSNILLVAAFGLVMYFVYLVVADAMRDYIKGANNLFSLAGSLVGTAVDLVVIAIRMPAYLIRKI